MGIKYITKIKTYMHVHICISAVELLAKRYFTEEFNAPCILTLRSKCITRDRIKLKNTNLHHAHFVPS